MNKTVVLNDGSGNLVEVDLKIFINHINHYHKTVASIYGERGYCIKVNETFREKLKKMSEGK